MCIVHDVTMVISVIITMITGYLNNLEQQILNALLSWFKLYFLTSNSEATYMYLCPEASSDTQKKNVLSLRESATLGLTLNDKPVRTEHLLVITPLLCIQGHLQAVIFVL